MSSIDPRIFRAYDIRGRAHEQLTADACRLIGHAFGSELRERTGKESPIVCVGRDARTHGPELEAAVTEGLLASGCNVALIGQTPSPVNYFTICTAELDGGVQVTASHNPAHDNGLKLSVEDAEAFSGEDLQRLRQRIENGQFLKGAGEAEEYDAVSAYAAFLESLFKDVGAGLSIVVDSGNGVAGPVYCDVLAQTGADVTGLYVEPDGTFPNHPADPSKWDTLKDLQAMVREREADIGLAFDGDGDRLGLVDETGTIRTADEILLLLARDHLSRFPGAPVVFTVSNSGILQSEIAAWGGKPVMCKVGHSFVEHAMRDHHALLGGEQSGHFFCGEDYFGFDDALVSALRVLSILKKAGVPLSSLFADFPKVFQAPERRPSVPDDRKLHVVRQVVEHFSKDHPVETMDGARIDFGDGAWAGIRASNTSPSISICIEARSQERLKEIEEMVLGHLKGYGEIEW
ncbi:MAG TPA: phosphomannomutase/phosphoglucomutase [Candidatus Peribacteraceae bacterium]|nr:phosphomannomutase/phosphoglucomutase [Candidatus Peribacteraceae bacterium]